MVFGSNIFNGFLHVFQLCGYGLAKRLREFRYGAAVRHVGGEPLDLQPAGLPVGQAALTHVENRFAVQLSHRGAVRTLHVVGVDFELGLRQDARFVAELDVPAGLTGVGALGVGRYVDQSAEFTGRFSACEDRKSVV